MIIQFIEFKNAFIYNMKFFNIIKLSIVVRKMACKTDIIKTNIPFIQLIELWRVHCLKTSTHILFKSTYVLFLLSSLHIFFFITVSHNQVKIVRMKVQSWNCVMEKHKIKINRKQSETNNICEEIERKIRGNKLVDVNLLKIIFVLEI